jgi:hypothetical protein
MTDTNIFRYALSSIIKEHCHKIRNVSDNIPHASLPPAFPVLRLSSCPPIRKEEKMKHYELKGEKCRTSRTSQLGIPFPKSSSSSCTTNALPTTALGPLKGICVEEIMRKSVLNLGT